MLANVKTQALKVFVSIGENPAVVKNMSRVGFVLAATFVTSAAFAVVAPTDTASFGYDFYDIAVVQILNGPIGFVGGLAAIVLGATQLMKSWPAAIMGVLTGTAIIRAEDITTSLGMLL